MKSIIILAIAASVSATNAADSSPTPMTSGSIELNVFGLSYHTNKYAIYNQVNPGIGALVSFTLGGGVDLVAAGGTYQDSYFATARYAMTGLRFVIGNRDGLNAKLALVGGYQDGSDVDGLGCFPILSVGYDRFNVCVTGDIGHDSNPKFATSNSHYYTTSMIAVFADIVVYKF
jgi:hypothetical protein